MFTFQELNLTPLDGLYILLIGIGIFFLTYLIYPPLIRLLKKKRWVGYDIHKVDRPETAESGGIGLTIGIIVGIIVVSIVFQDLWEEGVLFLYTVIASAVIGLIDDQIRLSSFKKIILMVGAGVPLFIANYFDFISVDNPTLPILGTLRLTILYPLILPFIIAITTNTVNMLEGYNGEGSGTCVIVLIFIAIAALISQSAEGLIFTIPVLAAIFAFFLFNRYPAKVFPGDVGTLVMGASIGLIGILGSLEVVMFVALLTHVFNSFYVLSSVRGFKESKQIKKKDIWLDKSNKIHASDEDGAAMTLPRLIAAKGNITEPELVKNFLALSLISGILALYAALLNQWTLNNGLYDITLTIIVLIAGAGLYFLTINTFPRVRGLSFIMIAFFIIGVGILFIIDQFIIDINSLVNWALGFVLGGIILFIWYYCSIRYFWTMIDQMKKRPGYISTAQHQKELQLETKPDDITEQGLKRIK